MTFTIYLGLFMRSPIIPLHFQALGASLIEIGLITSAFMVVAAGMAIPMGILSDRRGRRRLVLVGPVVSALASLLLALANSPLSAILINAGAGLGSAAYSPAITAFVGDTSRRSQGRRYGYYTAVMQTAMALGPGVGGLIADHFQSYPLTFLASSFIIAVGATIGFVFFPRDPAVPSRTETQRSGRAVTALLREKRLLISWVATISISFMWSVTATYLPLSARDCGLTVSEIGLLFTLQAATNALVRFPIGILYDRSTRHTALTLASILLGVGVTAIMATASSALLLSVLMGLFGIAIGATTTLTNATIAETLSHTSRGIGMGAYFLCLYGGMAAGPALLGPVMAVYGVPSGFLLTAGIGLIAPLLGVAFRGRSNLARV